MNGINIRRERKTSLQNHKESGDRYGKDLYKRTVHPVVCFGRADLCGAQPQHFVESAC